MLTAVQKWVAVALVSTGVALWSLPGGLVVFGLLILADAITPAAKGS